MPGEDGGGGGPPNLNPENLGLGDQHGTGFKGIGQVAYAGERFSLLGALVGAGKPMKVLPGTDMGTLTPPSPNMGLPSLKPEGMGHASPAA